MSAASPRRAQAHVEVHYRPAPELAPDEARRRVRLAYALLLGLVPWPCEAVPAPSDEALPGAAANGPAEALPLKDTLAPADDEQDAAARRARA
jgi:hypothetical protein